VIAVELSSNEITKEALLRLKAKGYECWRQSQAHIKGRQFNGKKGLSDIIGFVLSGEDKGKLVLCEVKKIGDKLSSDQIELLSKAKQSGCIVYVAKQLKDCVELEEYK
jgi:hypothetical protein